MSTKLFSKNHTLLILVNYKKKIGVSNLKVTIIFQIKFHNY